MSARTALLLSLAAAVGCGAEEGSLHLVGTVERTLLEVMAPTSEVLSEVAVARGDHVAAGRVVARLDASFAEAEIARAEAALAAARSGAGVAAGDLERARKLRRGDVTSQQQLERARLAHDESQARLREAGAALAIARKRRADLVLAAPAAGVVDQIPFELGERVPAGAVLVVILADEDPWVRVWLPETHFAGVAPGSSATIRIDGVEGSLRGRVLDVAREPAFTPHYALTERDRVHLVYETRVQILGAPDTLRPGVPADVELLSPRAEMAHAP